MMKPLEVSLVKQTEMNTIPSSLSSLDPTWVTVTELFPGQTGLKILLAILASSTLVQRALPACEQMDIAVLNCHNLATFARQAGCGKDTLLRYIKLYQALGLLTHTRVRTGPHSATQLSPPLTPYQPSSTALQRVEVLTHEGRQKQQELARSVRDRYLLTYGLLADPGWETAGETEPVTTLLRKVSDRLQQKRISQHERLVLQQEIEQMLTHRSILVQGDPPEDLNDAAVLLPERHPGDDKGDRQLHLGDPGRAERFDEEDHRVNKGDLSLASMMRAEDLPHKEGDLTFRKGSEPFPEVAQQKDLLHNGGDLATGRTRQCADLTSYQGDFSAQESNDVLDAGDLKELSVMPSSIDSFLHKDFLKKKNLNSRLPVVSHGREVNRNFARKRCATSHSWMARTMRLPSMSTRMQAKKRWEAIKIKFGAALLSRGLPPSIRCSSAHFMT